MAKKGMEGQPDDVNKRRAEVLDTIKNPLIFYALALLIVESSLSVVLFSGKLQGDQNFWAVIIMAALFVFVVLIVTFLTYYVPANLMAKLEGLVRAEAQRVSQETSKTLIRSQMVQNLKRLEHELSAFEPKEKVTHLQGKKRHPGSARDPLAIYVKPVLEPLVANPQFSQLLPEGVRKEIEKIVLSPDHTIQDVKHQIEEALRSLHG
jgi:hypothetical protein